MGQAIQKRNKIKENNELYIQYPYRNLFPKCYTDVDLLVLNSNDCFIKVQTAGITSSFGLSIYSSF